MRAGLLVLFVYWLGLGVTAEPRRVTITDALSQCYERNPDLAAARADTRQARSSYHLAGVFPTGSFVGGATRGWGPAALSSFSALPRDEYLQFQQPFFPFGAMKKGQYVAWLNWKQAEARLFKSRLQVLGGVRYERTEVTGQGMLFDPTAVFVRNADGTFARVHPPLPWRTT